MRKLPAEIVAEDQFHIAFLDTSPVTKGHTLVVPKKEVDNFFSLDDVGIALLVQFAKKVAKGMAGVIPCQRIGMHVHGLEIPHAHIHLVPIVEGEPHHFPRVAIDCPAGERKRIADAMRSVLV